MWGVCHKRLGHASESKLRQIDFFEKFYFSLRNKTYDSFLKEKHTILPFLSSPTKTVECLDLLHYDIFGDYRTPSLTGARYFLQ